MRARTGFTLGRRGSRGRTLEGLRRLGWTGDYVAWAHRAENELARLKDGKFFRRRRERALPGRPSDPEGDRRGGESGGLAISGEPNDRGLDRRHGDRSSLKASGWPANAEKITASLSNLKVDLKGLRGSELQWTKDNHFRTKQYYRVYRFDDAKGAIVRVQDSESLRRKITR